MRAEPADIINLLTRFTGLRWRGGAESIRQNSVFKDYVLLAEHPTPKRKYLYLLGVEHALRFFRGRRALPSVLSRDDKLRRLFSERFGDQFRTLREYYAAHGHAVRIEDVSPWLSELAGDLIADPATDELSE